MEQAEEADSPEKTQRRENQQNSQWSIFVSVASCYHLPAKGKKTQSTFSLIQKPAVRTAKLCHLGDKGTRKVYPGWALQWPGSLLFLFSSSGQPRRGGKMKSQVSDANLARGQLSLDVG